MCHATQRQDYREPQGTMNRLRNPKAFNAIRLLMLVISVSLAVLSGSAFHPVTQNMFDTVDDHGVHDLHNQTNPVLQISDNDCKKHASGSHENHERGSNSCCETFCTTIATSEFARFESLTIPRPKFRLIPNSVVLPGTYATPHRPPNA